MLEVINLTKTYTSARYFGREKNEAVRNVSFTVREGETLGIIGKSGCGKTTLAKLIVRLLPATSGQIYINGKNMTNISGKNLRSMRKEMQLIFQNPETALNPRMKVYQSIAEVLRINKLSRSNSPQEKMTIDELIQSVGLQKEQLSRYPHQLSGGQIQRVVLARVLALSPKLLVADEPTSMLDVSVQAQILSLIKEMRESIGCACIFISHDLDVIRIMCDKIAVMLQGNIIEIGETEEIFEQPEHSYTKELLHEFYHCTEEAGGGHPCLFKTF